MRVVFESEVDGTKLVGGPSRDVKIGGAVSGSRAGDDVGLGAVLGTRWNEEHAEIDTATKSKRSAAR
jgi:hypothetical protein